MIVAVITIAIAFALLFGVIAVLVSNLRKSRAVVVDIVAREVEKTIIKAAEMAKLEVMGKAEHQLKVLQGEPNESLERKINE